ncbi:MAG: hypothetical protein KKD38_02835 [Candidatus Delongbacteria bacterium]|nr:hypothetical protein [Candidatus Delongbacteria bacterium]
MHRYVYLNIFLFLFILSCATSSYDLRLGTGKPKFGSLEIEGISYKLSSENGEFMHGQPFNLFLKIKNISQVKKSFEISKNKLLIIVIKNEFSENLKIIDIPAEGYINGNKFSLDPDEERNFGIILDADDDVFMNNNSIYCQVRLFFLPKQFRRNSLSIYLEKK